MANERVAEGTSVVAPGREAFLADMLGRGATLPGACTFTSGQIDGPLISGTYQCADGTVIVELRHPDAAPATATRTAQFAIAVRSGSPPADFVKTLETRIRSREAAFAWTAPAPTPTALPARREPTAPRDTALLFAGGLLLLALVAWMFGRRMRWRPAAVDRLRRRLRRWRDGAAEFADDPIGRTRSLLADERFWMVAILLTSAIARGWLSLINRESNDDHFGLARMIRDGGWAAPPSTACMLCSHAKLYHYVLALWWQLTGSEDGSRIMGNLLNFAAGMVLLWVFYAYARNAAYSPQVRVLALAFMAFNGALVGIFSQTTNDGFCILFSSLAIFFLDRLLASSTLRHIIAATAFAILAALSKASGWVIFGCGTAILGVTLLAVDARRRRQFAVAAVVFVLGFLAVVPFVNPYRENLVRFHTPFVNDEFEVALLKMEVPRPAITWVYEDLLTFRIFDLLHQPYVDFLTVPSHRSSLWSQLYAKMMVLRFEQHIWPNLDPRLLSLGRLCLILGLLPLAALLVGTARRLRSTWRGVSGQGVRWFAKNHAWQHLVYAGVTLAALIALVVTYRRQMLLFIWMKVIYLFPAVLAFFALFLDGLESLWRRWPRLVTGWMAAAILVSMVNVGWLIYDLTVHPMH